LLAVFTHLKKLKLVEALLFTIITVREGEEDIADTDCEPSLFYLQLTPRARVGTSQPLRRVSSVMTNIRPLSPHLPVPHLQRHTMERRHPLFLELNLAKSSFRHI
jgi:hypothetical protein